MTSMLRRREFLQQSAAAGAAAWLAASQTALAAPATDAAGRFQFCAFTKFLQSLSFDELAATVADAGFRGVEAPVRGNGHFSMEQAPDKLPELVEALRGRDVEVTIMCTDLVRADQPGAEACLRTAKDLGIRRYRMGFYSYDLKNPVLAQLAEIGPALKDVAAMNRELGMQAVYQNHSGADMVGAAVWDIFRLIEPIDPAEVALAFDIRHATIEGGLAWPAVFNAVRDHIGAVFVKDFQWQGRRAEHVPLGTGRVDKAFFKMLAESDFSGPISLHVEYLGDQDAAANAAALKRDFATLRGWMNT
jgi:sugar phosphate isomerase/epimerase